MTAESISSNSRHNVSCQAQLRVVYHSFPLPYHRNAFLSSQVLKSSHESRFSHLLHMQGTQVVYAKLGAKAAFDYMTVVFR